MTSVSVLVSEQDAVAWDPALTTELGKQAEQLGLGYDGGESEGAFEVFDFEGDPKQVERAVTGALASMGVRRKVTRSDNFVTVVPKPGVWLAPLVPKDGAYEKALHRLAKRFAEQYAEWWASTGLTKLRFHEAHPTDRFGPGVMVPGADWQNEGELYVMHYTDLSILDEEPTKAEAEAVASQHLRQLLEGVAEHLGKPLP